MAATLGLDIGTNSVGSAWVDPDQKAISVGVSVFPAGVEETTEGRGAPNNQHRRSKRSLRRSIARRSSRKRKLRMRLLDIGLLPNDRASMQELMTNDPWHLRRKGLDEPITAFEFGRVLLHLCQRRGALGLKPTESDESASEPGVSKNQKSKQASKDKDKDGLVKDAVDSTKQLIKAKNARTFGELMASLEQERRSPVLDRDGRPKKNSDGKGITYSGRIRNRVGQFEFHADRAMLRDEFDKLWKVQKRLSAELANLLTDDFRKELDDPAGDDVWRHRGLLFGQRRTYWNIGTLGRCALEPTDQCVSIADRHASYYRVLETTNNLRMRGPGDDDFRPLTQEERQQVIDKLRSQKTGTVAAIREALGIDKRRLRKSGYSEKDYQLNIERDAERELNTDWFYREIVVAGVGIETWNQWSERTREGLNKALLRLDPAIDEDVQKLRSLLNLLDLKDITSDRLVLRWKTRPKIDKRLKLSRRAVRNLIPYMERIGQSGHWPTQIEARISFANDKNAIDATTDEPITDQQRMRYSLGNNGLNKRDRYYLRKHPELVLPPAPMLSNPVVRKAIHEVRRHVIAHIRQQGKKPDRIIIEFARETIKSAKANDEILSRNRKRESIRREIREQVIKMAYGENQFYSLTSNQLRAAEDRVLLLRQQRSQCAYQGNMNSRAITERNAALGHDVEIDHIIPYSRSRDNSLNNKVLCLRESNRNKGNQTPREWWNNDFDDCVEPMRRILQEGPSDRKADYFTEKDYVKKWRHFSATDVPIEWKGSQLSDTAYAAREVVTYLQQSLWPDEFSHQSVGAMRRIYVTKGAYTSQLRREWNLYQRVFAKYEPRENVEKAYVKDRGDHREHAIDAVAIAFTDPGRIDSLANIVKQQEEIWIRAKASGSKPEKIVRKKLDTPWGNRQTFRRQVLSQIYSEFDDQNSQSASLDMATKLVVSHRPVGRKILGNLHEDKLFGGIPGDETLFTGSISIVDLKPAHLRLPKPEKPEEAVRRVHKHFLETGIEKDSKRAKIKAKEYVSSPQYSPMPVEPSPGKSGLVRDLGLRRQLRKCIEERLQAAGFKSDADSFSPQELKAILFPSDTNAGKAEFKPLTMTSGVPIKRAVVLRKMEDPVEVPRKQWNDQLRQWESIGSRRSVRAYVGGNNHHMEIREDENGVWKGVIIKTFTAAIRARKLKLEPVDRMDNPQLGGNFVMSLSEGETVYMRHKETNEVGYFVVVKLTKPNICEFKWHWDARRATGQKDLTGRLLADSVRHTFEVAAPQLAILAAPGELTPIKVSVSPVGNISRIEPKQLSEIDSEEVIDSRILAIVKEALNARAAEVVDDKLPSKRPRYGSWKWMARKLKRERIQHLAPQLSIAMRCLQAKQR
jgi:CRISPR-associated endonuclease Csn1